MPSFSTDDFVIYDYADHTKTLFFDVSALNTGTQSTIVVPALPGGGLPIGTLMFLSGAQTISGPKTVDIDAIGTSGFYFTNSTPAAIPFMQLHDAATGFTLDVSLSGAIAADASLNLPATGGIVVTTTAVQTLTQKAMSTGTTLRSTSASSGVAWVDATDTTKVLRVLLSNLKTSTNNTFTLRTTAARDWIFEDTSGTVMTDTGTLTSDDDELIYEGDVLVA
jgi:hypothetical protein